MGNLKSNKTKEEWDDLVDSVNKQPNQVNMENEFVPYEQALALKELGFDEPCFKGFYNKVDIYSTVFNPVDFNNKSPDQPMISAPLYQQVFRWFRETHNIEGQVKSWKEKGGVIWHYSIQKVGEPSIFRSIDCAASTYEEAQLKCLQKLIEIVKDGKNTNS